MKFLDRHADGCEKKMFRLLKLRNELIETSNLNHPTYDDEGLLEILKDKESGKTILSTLIGLIFRDIFARRPTVCRPRARSGDH